MYSFKIYYNKKGKILYIEGETISLQDNAARHIFDFAVNRILSRRVKFN